MQGGCGGRGGSGQECTCPKIYQWSIRRGNLFVIKNADILAGISCNNTGDFLTDFMFSQDSKVVDNITVNIGEKLKTRIIFYHKN